MLALVERLGHPRTTVNALLSAALLRYWMGDHDGAREAAERAVAMARAHEFTTRIDDGLVILACLEARRGDRRALDEVYTWLSRPGSGAGVGWRTTHLVLVAEILSEVGDVERGLIALDAIAPEQRNAFLAPEIRRGRAQLLLRRNEADKAERQLREAIEMARNRSERTLELRATTSLARLWQQRGRRGEARQRLAEIYGWFTEGLDTADLRTARALLDELSHVDGY